MSNPEGPSFKLLGISFDMQLLMVDAIGEVVTTATWKMRTLLRTRRFYTIADLILLYKSHVLPFLEYRTAGIYHAHRDALVRLDHIQERFLEDIGISTKEAMLHFSLAPLVARRDIAMLGLVHRAALKKGPAHFWHFFQVTGTGTGKHRLTLSEQYSVRTGRTTLRTRSAFGLIPIYNMLPETVVSKRSVSAFQSDLQALLKECAMNDMPGWERLFSPRTPLSRHPLRGVI
jgi:hypothetical protein